jgi:hypothetical protein
MMVIPSPYTSAYPRTMVVKVKDAVLAFITVGCSHRSIDVADVAVAHRP